MVVNMSATTHECIAFISPTWSSDAVAGTLALLVPIVCSEMGSGVAEDVSAVALQGGISEGWVAAKLDGIIDEGGVTTDREWVTSELGGIAE
jgi:hypothetical protein